MHERLKCLADLIGDSLETRHRSDRLWADVVDCAEEESFQFVGRLPGEVKSVEIILVETTVGTEMTYRLSLMRVPILYDRLGFEVEVVVLAHAWWQEPPLIPFGNVVVRV